MAARAREVHVSVTQEKQARSRGLNLRLLEIFAAVVHANGMTGAATSLNLTQSAVSQAIANLEASVNAKIIDRGTRPLKLTLLGDIIYKRTVEILAKVQDLDRAVKLQTNEAIPLLRLGIANTVASTVGPYLVRKLDALAAQWTIWSGFAETGVQSLVERRIDFVITADDSPIGPEFINVPILEEPYLLVVPEKIAESHRTLDTLVGAAPFIRYGSHTFIGQAIDAYFQRCGLVPPNRYRLDTSDAVLGMVDEALGWTISTPLSILKARFVSPRFRCLPLPRTAPVRRISLISLASENDAVAYQIAESTRQALSDHCLPELRKIAPGSIIRTKFGSSGRSTSKKPHGGARAARHRAA